MDRFLAVQFLAPFMVCIAGFTAAYLLSDVFDRFHVLVEYQGLNFLGFRYFLLKLPLLLSEVMPVASLAGVLLGFALLNRTGEVLACQQLGVSRLEMALPVLVIAALISAGNFALREAIVPHATRQARYLYTVELKKRELRSVFASNRIWVRIAGGFMSADSYDSKTNHLRGVTLYQLDERHDLKEVVHARNAVWNGKTWVADHPSALRLDGDGGVTAAADARFALELTPDDFNLVSLDPEEFSLWELKRYIETLREKGLDPRKYVVDLELKYALPVACLIMVALGMVLSLDPLPRNASIARSFVLALVIGFGYWLMMGLTSSLGKGGVLAPWLAAWLPNMTFGTLAAAIFLFGEER
jgi:lipopolysaccharide export system permease protein